MHWDAKLSEPIKLRDCRELVTLMDVGNLMLELPELSRVRPSWQHAGELLMEGATSGDWDTIAEMTDQLERALMAEGLFEPREIYRPIFCMLSAKQVQQCRSLFCARLEAGKRT
jgi:hypothetical protein